MSLADLRQRSRRALHDRMAVPAFYYPTQGSESVACTVRRILTPGTTGDLAGTNLSYVETVDFAEKLVFLHGEVGAPLVRNGLVVLDEEEGYFVDTVMPPYGITVTCDVVRAVRSQMIGRFTPDGIEIV